MHPLLFWKDWYKSHKTIWFILCGVFLFALGYMWFAYFQGTHGIVEWERMQEQKIIETPVHEFRVGPFQLSVPGESYVIFEYLEGGDVRHNRVASGIFLTILVIAAVVLLTIITTLKKFWYFAGVGLFVAFVFSLQLDVPVVFGIRGYTIPIGVSAIFVALSYYFKSFRSSTGLGARLLCFAIVAAVCGIAIALFSQVPYPLLHIVATAYLSGLILTIVFMLMVAHEIVASFVYVASQGKSKSLRHFLMISVVYFVNVFLTCFHEMGVIDWDFIYINLYLLLTTSALLGIWGFRLREPVYESILPFRPLGAFLYLALAAICFATIGQLLGNGNDAALKIVRDIIIFSHTGYGIIFMTYFISNFIVMMADNLPVYKLIYKPNRMPYFTFRLAGLIATLAFVFYSDYRQYVFHGLAGFYNYIADLYVLQGRDLLAQDFYDESRRYGFQTHRANYALGKMKSARINFEGAHYNYDLANARRPSEFSLVNKGNLYLWEKEYFPAIKAYRHGKEIMPNSAALANNLGYAYGKVHSLDSATWFINEARQHLLTKNAAEGNFLALAAVEYLPIRADSVVKLFNNESPVVASNALALATLFNQEISTNADPLAQHHLNLYSATLLNNYTIRHARTIDTTFISQVNRIASDSLNFDYSEALKATLAHAYYHRGNVTKALEILAELAFVSQSYRGKYNYIMGLWALDQGNPEIASGYFMHAETADYKDSKFYNAIALTEAGNVFDAYVAWDSVARRGDPSEQEIAKRMQRILGLTQSQALQLDDPEKYQYCRYKIGLSDTTFFDRLTNTFNSADYKAQALLDMAKRQFRAQNLAPAIRYLNQISGLELTSRQLYEDVRFTELLMLAWRREGQLLATQINKGVEFGAGHELEKMWYTALISEMSGDLETAERNYRIVGTWNPYFEEGIIAAANFLRTRYPESLDAYSVLVEAIQVNHNSYRLLLAYLEEAERLGFDEYAASARQRLRVIAARRR
jgi:Flp pilus assembly protein TadD